jgi:hypothetical protein
MRGDTMQSITITIKSNYGAVTAYPACPRAQAFARIAGTKTLTVEVLKTIRELGYEIIQQHADTIKF